MKEAGLIQQLMDFSLTRQEAQIYLELMKHPKLTGYELSKLTGISRSNVYGGLTGLTEKGAASIVEDTAVRYIPVPVREFCENRIHRLQRYQQYLEENIPDLTEYQDGYITVIGYENIREKAGVMMKQAKNRFYLAGTKSVIESFRDEIVQGLNRDLKIILISDYDMDQDPDLKGAICYVTEQEDNQIRLITDSKQVLTGSFSGKKEDSCLFSGQEHLVKLIKEALGNKIELMRKEGK